MPQLSDVRPPRDLQYERSCFQNVSSNNSRTTSDAVKACHAIGSSNDEGGEPIRASSTIGQRDPSHKGVLYFAYGANMSPSILTRKRGVRPTASLPAQAIALPRGAKTSGSLGSSESLSRREDGGVCLCFCHRAGYATLASLPGPPQEWQVSPGAHGVLHSVSPDDMEQIARVENGYRKCMIEVETYDGQQDYAFAFISDPMQVLPTSVPPTIRYLSLLRDGADFHGLTEEYQGWLGTIPSVPSEGSEMSPERTNTLSKKALNASLALTCVVAVGATTYFVTTGM